jgi:hypothetical protein
MKQRLRRAVSSSCRIYGGRFEDNNELLDAMKALGTAIDGDHILQGHWLVVANWYAVISSLSSQIHAPNVHCARLPAVPDLQPVRWLLWTPKTALEPAMFEIKPEWSISTLLG